MAGVTLVGQSGGVTPVINATLAGVIATARACGPVLGMRHGMRGLLDGDIVALDGFDDTRLARLRLTPSAFLGSCRFAPSEAEIDLLLDRLRALDVRRLIYIGGNDSAATSARLHAAAVARGQEIAVVGAPKTIDNDLPCMDHTPGYPSAAAYVALAARLLWLDSRAMRREEPLRIVEVKGRHSGWLAAACAQFVPRGGLIVLAPERPLDPTRLIDQVEAALARHGCALVAVSEHLDIEGGRRDATGYADDFGHTDSAAPGETLRRLLERGTGRRCRLEVLGALQKVALLPANELDRVEAFAAGEAAVRAALAGESGVCVTLDRVPGEAYGVAYGRTPLSAVAATERLLPESFLEPSGAPSDEFRTWLAPLITEAAAAAGKLLEDDEL
jgi:6-phosphofructokinase 1